MTIPTSARLSIEKSAQSHYLNLPQGPLRSCSHSNAHSHITASFVDMLFLSFSQM